MGLNKALPHSELGVKHSVNANPHKKVGSTDRWIGSGKWKEVSFSA